MCPVKLYIYIICAAVLCACGPQETSVAESEEMTRNSNRPFNTPAWAKQANFYELNVRQYSPEGTFAAAQRALPRLKGMGVDVVWVMPIYPISETKRKGTAGSYYASSSFTEVNPEFGTKADFNSFVDAAHAEGLYVILDWTANHTGWDHPWIEEHPEFYIRDVDTDTIRHAFNPQDENGGETDWYDIAQLDHTNEDLHAAMIADMQYWLREFDVDGFRCDVAGFVPIEFWYKVRPALESVKPVFMLAEWGDEPEHFEAAFDINYGWDFHKLLNSLAEGEANAADVWMHQEKDTALYAPYAYHLNFTSNHDENSWNGTEFERMGALADAMFVVAATFEGAPLVYSGQEEPLRRRLEFFEKDDIGFGDYAKEDFFRKLLRLRHVHPALAAGEAGGRASRLALDPKSSDILAYARERDGQTVMVLVNLDDEDHGLELIDGFAEGTYYDVMTGASFELARDVEVSVPGSGYKVYSTLAPDGTSD